VTKPSAAICQIPSLPFNAKYAQLTAQGVSRINASGREPHQRTVDETLRVSLAFSGHSENV
jgi:hypothetical protein